MTRFRQMRTMTASGAPDSERGSMAIVLLVMLVGLSLGALLVPMIITQDRTTRFDNTRVQALDAAQAGLDVTLGSIRASQTSSIGDSSKLPCGSTTAPITGVVNNNSAAAYSVVLEYFTFDPVNEPNPSTNAMRCVNGSGTYDPVSGSTTPGFARLTSTGTVGAAINGSSSGRTLIATYTFRTSNVNLLGGVVQIGGGSSSLCMDAGSSSAPAGTAVVLQACSSVSPPAAQQVFSYRSDLTLQLTSSVTAANTNGLCLAPASSGSGVQLALCGPLGSPTYNQQWSYNDNGQYQAALSTSATTGKLADLCMTVGTASPGQPIILSSCGSAANWVPSSAVGPGAAAPPQWINYQEFGRCLDVTGQQPSTPFLIDYPCKQNPYPGAVTWNQLFAGPPNATNQPFVTGQIYTTTSGQNYCLTSPGTDGGYVTVQVCTANSPSQSWTVYTGDKSLNYSTKYTVVNGSLCLGLGPAEARSAPWSIIDVESCTGTTDQKWNAVPNILNSTVKNVRER